MQKYLPNKDLDNQFAFVGKDMRVLNLPFRISYYQNFMIKMSNFQQANIAFC